MSDDSILTSRDCGVLTLTLNRPAAFNSFTRPMAAALQAGLDEAAGDDSIRCVVLTGEGKAFCAGQDLKEVTADDAPPLEDIVHGTYNTTVRKMRALAKPVIAAVNGVAAGAGFNIALAADLCVATESARFIQAFSKIGLIPDSGGTWMLPKLIGLQRATALAYLGTPVGAAEAAAMGMIHRAFPAPEMAAVGVSFVGLGREEIFHEAQDKHFAQFKARLAREQDLVSGHHAQHALPVFGQAITAGDPRVLCHGSMSLEGGGALFEERGDTFGVIVCT